MRVFRYLFTGRSNALATAALCHGQVAVDDQNGNGWGTPGPGLAPPGPSQAPDLCEPEPIKRK